MVELESNPLWIGLEKNNLSKSRELSVKIKAVNIWYTLKLAGVINSAVVTAEAGVLDMDLTVKRLFSRKKALKITTSDSSD